jgi:glyoxylase-like metal-dependent hydrolase (beta-lactamase superfamily II)
VIHLPQDSIFHRGGSGLYLVGHEELTLIDTGNTDHAGSKAVLECLAATPGVGRLCRVLLTHCHRDHVGGLGAIGNALSSRSGAAPEVYAHPLAVECLKEEWGFPAARPIADGEAMVSGGVSLTAVHTPGHSPDHLCFFEPRSATLFSGDLVLGSGSAWVGDLIAALASLRVLLTLRPRLLCPGHGPLVADASRRVRTYIAHRYLRERQIVQKLSLGSKTSAELARVIYPRLDPRLGRAAEGNILAHLQKLEREGRVVVAEGSAPVFSLVGV